MTTAEESALETSLRTKLATAKKAATTTLTLEQSPSIPSVRLVLFTNPQIRTIAKK